MAKGKGGKSKGFVSQGIHSNVSKSTKRLVRQASDNGTPLHLLECYLKGQDPWITIANPNKEQTNRQFIKIKASKHYGHLKERNDPKSKVKGYRQTGA